MTTWSNDELRKITEADDLHISPLREVDGPINDRIDDAYRAKYHGSPYLSPMIGARARSGTVKVMPREINELVHRTPKEKQNAEA
jgi:hypothetical protein